MCSTGKIPQKALKPAENSAIIEKKMTKAGEEMNAKSDYIAVFDSGVGGISVLRELMALMPQERYLYFGDSANAPYGQRSTQEIRELTLAAAQMLMDRGIKALVIACNTATAAAVDALRSQYPDGIIVGIEPALKVAADHFPGKRIGVLATPVTLREEKFCHQLERFSDAQVVTIPVTGLVELVEAGKGEGPEAEALLKQQLAPYIGKLDAVVLGCTHYPFASGVIQKIFGTGTVLLDGGPGTARETKRRLEKADLLWEGPGELQMENSLADPTILQRCMELLEGENRCLFRVSE